MHSANKLTHCSERVLDAPLFGVGPELEVPAYGCEDHFQELDTAEHSWECIAELLRGSYTNDILCDVGMPIIHRGDFFIISSTCPSLKPPKAMHRCNPLADRDNHMRMQVCGTIAASFY